MTQPRIHEVAKQIGVTSKILMNELASKGFEFKTHMAVLEGDAWAYVTKKYSQVKAEGAAPASATKKTSAKSTGSEGKSEEKPKVRKKAAGVVTQRTQTKKKESAPVAASSAASPRVEILSRDEGAEKVTLQQTVVKGGVLRRRRVDPSTVPPPPPPVPSPANVEALPEEPVPTPIEEVFEEEVETLVPVADEPLEVIEPEVEEEAPKGEPPATTVTTSSHAPTTPVAPTPTTEGVSTPTATPSAPLPTTSSSPSVTRTIIPAATGRNLSAPSRLKIVATPPPSPYPRPTGPRPAGASRPATPATGATSARPAVPAKGIREEEEAEAKRGDAKKKAAAALKGFEDSRVTKRDLLGMVEEVEIQRPLGRKMRRPTQRVERKATQITTPGAQKRKIRIEDEISVADLASAMGLKGAEIIQKLLKMGQMVTIQQKLDLDTATLVASDYGYEVQNVAETADSVLESFTTKSDKEGLPRPPIVTVMGHVDHGKTSLLDAIRSARVAAGEAGGITQHIGAYQIEKNGKLITFIDTPGHAAFTSMRARGAKVTDLVILVVAADEGVMPQTLEALAHAKAAKVPIIVAVNKIDKPEAKPETVMQQLAGYELVPEAWGGETIYVNVSAKEGRGIPELLEMILLQSEVLDLKAPQEGTARAFVIESRLDKGKGPVATLLVQSGVLRVGTPIVCGVAAGKLRAMFDDRGQQVKEAGPSTPVEVLGFDAVPDVGDIAISVTESDVARKVSELSIIAKKKADTAKLSRLSLEDMYKKLQAGEMAELRVILKGDVQGSVEAIADSLSKIEHAKVRVEVIYKAVGGITESDVDLAAASGAIVLGFNVRPAGQAKDLAARENVQIKTYSIIYELIDEVKRAMAGLLAPVYREQALGTAEVREVFTISRVGPVAGCFVKSGKISRNAQARVIRDSIVVYTTKVSSLRRFKDDAKEVAEGFECGIRLENFTDLKQGDLIECFESIQIAQAVG